MMRVLQAIANLTLPHYAIADLTLPHYYLVGGDSQQHARGSISQYQGAANTRDQRNRGDWREDSRGLGNDMRDAESPRDRRGKPLVCAMP